MIILDRYDNFLCKFAGSFTYWNAIYERRGFYGASFFEFSCIADHRDSEHIKEGNQVAFKDREDKWRLFKLESVNLISDSDGDYINVVCQSGILELLKNIIPQTTLTNQPLNNALATALQGTRYQVGNTAPLGTFSFTLEKQNSIQALNKILDLYGAELEERIEVSDDGEIARFIDLPARLGVDTGKVLEISKDVLQMVKTTSTGHIVTALHGEGASILSEVEGESKRLDFADIEWSVANGDPLDKPLGQTYLEDPEATEMFGLPYNGTFLPLFAKSTHHSIREPEELLLATYYDLQQRKQPFYNFEMDIFALGDLVGYEAHKIRLGDTVRVVNRQFARPILVESRIIKYSYDVANPSAIAEVELGHFLNLYGENDRLDRIESEIGQIGSRPLPPVTGDGVVGTPQPIVNFEATGLFRTINLNWENQTLGVRFELHASQVQGFTPSSANMIYRGYANAFNHSEGVDTDQHWSYRLRATNVRGEVGPWSEEIIANTVRITGDFIEYLTIGDAHIGSVAVDKLIGGTGKFVDLQGATIRGSIIETIGGNSTIRMEHGRMSIIDGDNAEAVRLTQNRMDFFNHLGEGNMVGHFGRMHTAGQPNDILGTLMGVRNGYTAAIGAQMDNPPGIHSFSVAVDGTTGETTLSRAIMQDLRTLWVSRGSGDSRPFGYRSVTTTTSLGTPDVGTIVMNYGNDRGAWASDSGGFYMNNSGDCGLIWRGRAQLFDVNSPAFSAGNTSLGRLQLRWNTVEIGAPATAGTWSGTVNFAVGFSNTPITIPVIGALSNPQNVSVSLSGQTPTGFTFNVFRPAGISLTLHWLSIGRRAA